MLGTWKEKASKGHSGAWCDRRIATITSVTSSLTPYMMFFFLYLFFTRPQICRLSPVILPALLALSVHIFSIALPCVVFDIYLYVSVPSIQNTIFKITPFGSRQENQQWWSIPGVIPAIMSSVVYADYWNMRLTVFSWLLVRMQTFYLAWPMICRDTSLMWIVSIT